MGKIADANRRARKQSGYMNEAWDAAFPGLDEKQDTRADLSEVSPGLVRDLRDLGSEFGPLGVARVAAALTDIDVLIRNLGGVVPGDEIPVPSMDAKKWTTPALLNLLGAIHDELDRRGVDVNDHPEYRQPGYTAPPKKIRNTTDLADWAEKVMTAPQKQPDRAPCPTLTRTLEAVALRAARKAIAEHLGED